METVKIEGVREIIENLSKTVEDMKKAQRSAVKKGAEVVAKELERNVPSSGYRGSNAQPKMKNHVVTSGARTGRDSFEYYSAVGFPKGIAHRAHFPEFGTIAQSPQFYYSKTINNSWQQAQDAMIAEVKRVLG